MQDLPAGVKSSGAVSGSRLAVLLRSRSTAYEQLSETRFTRYG